VEEGWELERAPRRELTVDELSELVEPAFPGRQVAEIAVLTTGLANTNIRFRLNGDSAAYVLRLHTREAAAAQRELDLMTHLSSSAVASGVLSAIPRAPLVYSDPAPQRGECPYSIWGFVEGTLLQELFMSLGSAELVGAAGACGSVLASLSAQRFDRCGELGPRLEVVKEYGSPSRFVAGAVHQALFRGRAGQRLGAPLRDDLWRAVERASPRLAVIDDRYTLVHGDYKRSNILMQRSAAGWRVSAVLDWEFAFAGPPLVDVGLFLRAGEALPAGFREAFAAGYREAGGELPADWLPLSRLVDLLSQVTFLDDARDRPRVFAETTEVVKETLRMLS
jgi:aminoglycoside phosphotransferase (APT) family kinase protein